MFDGRVDRLVTRAGPPQIRTCAINASGSSVDSFAKRSPSFTRCRSISLQPILLSVVVSLTRFRVSVHPPCVPPTVLSAGLPSTGSARGRSPASSVRRKTPTPDTPSGRLLSRHLTVPPPCPSLRSPRQRAHPRGAWRVAVRSPRSPVLCFRWRASGLPGSWGTPKCACPALRPRRDGPCQASTACPCSLPLS
jgi:hypothetical protein